jgi:DnaK suppressor protein
LVLNTSDTPDLEAIRRRLLSERDELRAASDAQAEARRPVTLDQQSVGRLSRMDAMQVQAMAQETERRRQNRTKRIESALSRIEKGEFGFCARCGDDIDARRLQLDPTVVTCIRCAQSDGS